MTNRHIGVRQKLFGGILSGCGGFAFDLGRPLCLSAKNAGASTTIYKKAASYRVAAVCWEHRAGPDFSLNLIQLGDTYE